MPPPLPTSSPPPPQTNNVIRARSVQRATTDDRAAHNACVCLLRLAESSNKSTDRLRKSAELRDTSKANRGRQPRADVQISCAQRALLQCAHTLTVATVVSLQGEPAPDGVTNCSQPSCVHLCVCMLSHSCALSLAALVLAHTHTHTNIYAANQRGESLSSSFCVSAPLQGVQIGVALLHN